MSNTNFFLLLVGVVLLVIGFFKYRKRAITAEKKIKELANQLVNVESEREQLSRTLQTNRLM